MIKITKIEKHEIGRLANPTKVALENLLIPISDLTAKQELAQYIIDTYNLGQLDGIKTATAKHVLDFTCIAMSKRLHITAHITMDV